MRAMRPWYRASKRAWYVQIDRVKVRLADNETDAWTAFYKLMHERGQLIVDPDTISFAHLADEFLDRLLPIVEEGQEATKEQKSRKSTYDWYKRFIDDFCGCFTGAVPLLTPSHVTAWLDGHPNWSQATRRGGIVAVKRVIHWGLTESRLIKVDPLTALKRPDTTCRKVCLSADALAAIVKVTDTAFAAFALAIRETGARPGEVRTVEARQFDEERETWTFRPEECIKKSKRPRVFHLTPAMVTLSKALAELRPEGPMFRNRLGKPWTANAVRCRMRRLRAKGILPKGAVATSFRHGYATDALENGVTNVELAQLMGHRDTKMIDLHYGHLDQRTQHLKKAARRAVG